MICVVATTGADPPRLIDWKSLHRECFCRWRSHDAARARQRTPTFRRSLADTRDSFECTERLDSSDANENGPGAPVRSARSLIRETPAVVSKAFEVLEERGSRRGKATESSRTLSSGLLHCMRVNDAVAPPRLGCATARFPSPCSQRCVRPTSATHISKNRTRLIHND